MQHWFHNFHPDRPDITAELQALASKLNGRLEEPPLRCKYAWLKDIVSYEKAQRTRVALPVIKAALLRNWDKAMFRLEQRKTA
jgi:hypothetical protein